MGDPCGMVYAKSTGKFFKSLLGLLRSEIGRLFTTFYQNCQGFLKVVVDKLFTAEHVKIAEFSKVFSAFSAHSAVKS